MFESLFLDWVVFVRYVCVFEKDAFLFMAVSDSLGSIFFEFNLNIKYFNK